MLYRFGRFIFTIYMYIFYRVVVQGLKNVPQNEGIIICSNHIHWLDPILLGVVFKRKINFMAKEELFKNKFIAMVLRGINAFPVKRGTADISAIKTSLRIIKDGKVLGIFPEGTRSRDGKLKPAEPGVSLIAIKTGAPIIPVRIIGSYKLFSKLKVVIGKPMLLGDYKSKKLSSEDMNNLSQSIMKEISDLT